MTDVPGLKFPSLRQAVSALNAAGYEVSRSKMSRDKNNGLIDFNPDGSVDQREVEKYSRLLKKREASMEDNHEKAAIKADWEIKNLEIKFERQTFELEKDKGKYIERALFEQELAARAMIFENGFRNMFATQAAEWIAMVGGKPGKLPDFMRMLNQALDEQLSAYATTRTFQVLVLDDGDKYDNAV